MRGSGGDARGSEKLRPKRNAIATFILPTVLLFPFLFVLFPPRPLPLVELQLFCCLTPSATLAVTIYN